MSHKSTTTPQAALLSRMDAYLSGNSCEATAIIKNARDLLAKLQATQAEPTIPWLTKEQFGYALHCAQVVDAATSEIARLRSENAALNERLDATQEPVQAGWAQSGSGDTLARPGSIIGAPAEINPEITQNRQEPVQAGELPTLPERVNLCGGDVYGYSGVQMHAYARAALSARKPLPYDLICNAIDLADTESMKCDYMLDSSDCIAVVRTMQALIEINGIGLEVKP